MKRFYRLRNNSDFQQVRKNGKFHSSHIIVLSYCRNELEHSRFGFVVSKRIGKAVQRNKVKRRMRETIRLRIPQIKTGFDLIFIARQPIRQAGYKKIEASLERLLKKADLLL